MEIVNNFSNGILVLRKCMFVNAIRSLKNRIKNTDKDYIISSLKETIIVYDNDYLDTDKNIKSFISIFNYFNISTIFRFELPYCYIEYEGGNTTNYLELLYNRNTREIKCSRIDTYRLLDIDKARSYDLTTMQICSPYGVILKRNFNAIKRFFKNINNMVNVKCELNSKFDTLMEILEKDI